MKKVDKAKKDSSLVKRKTIMFFSFVQRFILGILMNIVGPLIPVIASDLKVGLHYIGTTISIGTVALLITALTTGFLIEFFGFKKVLYMGGFLIIFGCFGLFFAYSFLTFTLSYFVLQFGVGIIGVNTLSLVGNHYFKEKSKNIMQVNIGFTIGAVAAPLLASLIVALDIRWQILFIYLFLPQAIMMVILIFLKIPKDSDTKESFDVIFKKNKIVLLKPFIILCGVMILLYVALRRTFYTWFTSYFTTLDVDLDISSLILAFYSTAVVIGMCIKNYLLRYVKETKLLIINLALATVLLVSIFFVPNLIIKIILLFLFGISIAGNFSLTFSISLNVGSKYSSAISSLLHAYSYLGVIIFQYISGYFSEYFSKSSVMYIDIGLLLLLFIVAIFIQRKEKRVKLK